ncbi:(2Fe-2S)-binding protein [Desulfomonile tiedjei]|uniref:Aerobic-type carbon monoxide dehydrogenase, small subunit CoxS/CutS-like protein n=1 Tax=Desulfomonile tiedjei (strain ATCC 49306 / DSM 6799 / DCB-1) TaxID=706587 RepID=I4C4Q9_DESTA|nr:(2Fe-2S)-binding protein [Desulfomonile tiedjei]AFM24550.1 aerobic-type carbon monoxide dehydrogenase, small subunit CoxS/CutS-like protein [Desulfomonile tiedjei DSM 6799]
MNRLPLEITINGEPYSLTVEPNRTLLELLRDDLDLTGAKEGCGEGVCGSCTVLLDGNPVRSCLTLALEANGSHVTTVEGLAGDGELDPLQQSFIDHGAVQCGFCTSGMLMTSKGLLLRKTHPEKKEILAALSGHTCRCTGYTKIIEAVEAVVDGPKKER